MPQWIETTINGVRWQVASEHREQLLGPDGLRLEEWLKSGQARVVKHGPHRTVYHVALPHLDFYLKHYRLMDLRSRLRQLVRPSQSRTEYEKALAVAERQVPTFTPLGLGEVRTAWGPGENFIISRSLEETEPLNTFIETTLPAMDRARHVRIRQRLAAELGKFLARMHDAGIVHHDLHPGNMLIRLGEDERIELYLIDLHAVKLSHSLGWKARRNNLIILNRWFVLRSSRSDRLRFWRAYRDAETRRRGDAEKNNESVAASPRRRVSASPFPATRHAPRATRHAPRATDLEEATWASNLWFWRNRDRRCLFTNRYYERVRSRCAVGHAVRDLDRDALKSLLDDPDEPFRRPGAVLLKDSRSSTVAEFEMMVNGEPRRVIYKRFRLRSWSEPWLALVRRSAALRSWVFGHGLRERGLPTPRPLAAFHRRRGGLCHEGYLLVEKVPDAVDLHRHFDFLKTLPPVEGRAVLHHHIEDIARLIRELHRRHLSHRDLKAANILVAGGGWRVAGGAPSEQKTMNFSQLLELSTQHSALSTTHLPRATRHAPPATSFWFIDLVGVRRHRNLSHKCRVRDLARLHASFHQNPFLTRSDKLRFLRIYLQWGLFGRDGWKKWWQDVEQATQAKITRNLRNGRPLA